MGAELSFCLISVLSLSYLQRRNLVVKNVFGNSLAVQWLGLCALTARGLAQVRFLVRELRSCNKDPPSYCEARKKKKKKVFSGVRLPKIVTLLGLLVVL